jgi:hypothetical protein
VATKSHGIDPTMIARSRSVTSIVRRLFQRSTSAPASGPNRMTGAVKTTDSFASSNPPVFPDAPAPTSAMSAMW